MTKPDTSLSSICPICGGKDIHYAGKTDVGGIMLECSKMFHRLNPHPNSIDSESKDAPPKDKNRHLCEKGNKP